jgi:hypothetical protein
LVASTKTYKDVTYRNLETRVLPFQILMTKSRTFA